MKLDEALAKSAQTQKDQAADDSIGMEAATATLPGPVRGAFDFAPDIQVGKYRVRRFVSRDFVRLASLGHPLNGLKATQDSENFVPEGMNCWLLCWMMTRPVEEVKKALYNFDVEKIKLEAGEEFGEMTTWQLTEIVTAIAKNLSLIDSAKVEYKAIQTGGDEGKSPPSLSQP